jgi:D-alanyl-D-alanine dipeptidase
VVGVKKRWRWAVACGSILAWAGVACDPGDPGQLERTPTVEAQTVQHLLVVTESPGDIHGRLFRMERDEDPQALSREPRGQREPAPSGEPATPREAEAPQEAGFPQQAESPRESAWRMVGEPIPVVVGWAGVGPKREGDGRSPEGVFDLGPVFGYARQAPPSLLGSALPYLPMSAGAICVDDPASVYYNRIFDPDTLPEAVRAAKDWSSFESMRRDLAHGDDLYKWGVVAGYNQEAEPGSGSCIFLHVWRGPDSPTAGCTAMAEDDLLAVLGWLERGAEHSLVQGTRSYLEGLRREGLLSYDIPPPPSPTP